MRAMHAVSIWVRFPESFQSCAVGSVLLTCYCFHSIGVTNSTINIDNDSCNEYYACSYNLGNINDCTMTNTTLLTQILYSLFFLLLFGIIGTSTISYYSCNGVYACRGLSGERNVV